MIPILLLAWMATQDWLSFVVVIVLVLAVPLTMVFFGREATRRSARQWRRLGSLAGRFLQLVEGLPTLRAFGREGQGRREVAAATEGVRAATMRTLRVAFLSALAMDMIAGFGVGFVAMALGLRLLWGELGLQTAMAVLLVAPEIFIPLRRAGAEFHASTEGQAAATRILEVLGTATTHRGESRRRPRARTVAGPRATTATPASRVAAAPADHADGVRVDYGHRDGAALVSFSLDAPPGSRVALTGPSGAGKSTALDALLGFVTPTEGTIDGRRGDCRSAATVDAVAQTLLLAPAATPHLPRHPRGEPSPRRARRRRRGPRPVCSPPSVSPSSIANLPAGLDTVFGHDGLTLSGGERQRVALARALALSRARPPPRRADSRPRRCRPWQTSRRRSNPGSTGRTVVVAAHEPVLLPHFDIVLVLGRARRTTW